MATNAPVTGPASRDAGCAGATVPPGRVASLCSVMRDARDLAITRAAAEGRIVEAVADGTALVGTLDRLARRFDLAPEDLRGCLRQLVRVGWVAVQAEPFGRLTIRLARRTEQPESAPVTTERRRGVPDAWRL